MKNEFKLFLDFLFNRIIKIQAYYKGIKFKEKFKKIRTKIRTFQSHIKYQLKKRKYIRKIKIAIYLMKIFPNIKISLIRIIKEIYKNKIKLKKIIKMQYHIKGMILRKIFKKMSDEKPIFQKKVQHTERYSNLSTENSIYSNSNENNREENNENNIEKNLEIVPENNKIKNNMNSNVNKIINIIMLVIIIILIQFIIVLISMNIEKNNHNIHYYINGHNKELNYEKFVNNVTYLNKRETFSPNLITLNKQYNIKPIKNEILKEKIGMFSELFDEFNFWVENVRNKTPINIRKEVNKLKKELKYEKDKNKKLYHQFEFLIKKLEQLENDNKRLRASIAGEDLIHKK